MQTLRSWEVWTRQKSIFEEIHARRLNAKEVLTPKKSDFFIFPIADGTAKLSGRDHGVRESTSIRDQPVRNEELKEDLQGNSEKCQPRDETKDDAEVRHDFWSIEGDFNCRHQVEPRVQHHVPRQETFPIPLKYVDVTRTTHVNMEVSQESRVDDYWNVDVDRSLSYSWTGFTKFTL